MLRKFIKWCIHINLNKKDRDQLLQHWMSKQKGRQKTRSTELERNTLEEIQGFILFFGLGGTRSSASPGWFWTYYVVVFDLSTPDLPASTCQVLGIQACFIIPGFMPCWASNPGLHTCWANISNYSKQNISRSWLVVWASPAAAWANLELPVLVGGLSLSCCSLGEPWTQDLPVLVSYVLGSWVWPPCLAFWYPLHTNE